MEGGSAEEEEAFGNLFPHSLPIWTQERKKPQTLWLASFLNQFPIWFTQRKEAMAHPLLWLLVILRLEFIYSPFLNGSIFEIKIKHKRVSSPVRPIN